MTTLRKLGNLLVLDNTSPKKYAPKTETEVINLVIGTDTYNGITTTIIAAQTKEVKKKEDKPVFFQNFVRIGYKNYPIQIAEEGKIHNILGLFDVKEIESEKEFISKDGKILWIKEDYQGNKYLVE